MDPWKHRTKGMKCSTCLWYVKKESTTNRELADDEEGIPIIGRCRRHAPTMNGYPAVFPADWCGDHKMDENKL